MKSILRIRNFTLLFFSMAFTLVSAQDKGQGHRLIISFTGNDSMQMKAVLMQLSNIEEEWPEAEVEVVLYNFGLDLLLKSNNPYIAKIAALRKAGIKFVACENTMNRRKISADKLIDGISFVKAGIPEIVLKQEAGWSYIVGGF